MTTGVISTVVGTGSTLGSINTLGPCLAIDGAGNLYYADINPIYGYFVKKADFGAATVTTIAGAGLSVYDGDGGLAVLANVGIPTGLAIDGAVNLFIADAANGVIRKVDMTTSIITTYAGVGYWGYSGDGGFATSAYLNEPEDLAFDHAGNLYIADYGNAKIRKVTPAGIISTYAGGGFSGDYSGLQNANAVRLHSCIGVVCDQQDNVYIADDGLYRILMVCNTNTTISISATPFDCASGTKTFTATSSILGCSIYSPTYTWYSSTTTSPVASTMGGTTSVYTDYPTSTGEIIYCVLSNFGNAINNVGCEVTSNSLNTSDYLSPVLPITGSDYVCVGNSTTLEDGTSGGTWSSSDNTIATVDASGVVTGVSGGVCVITYTVGGGCVVTKTITINPIPAPITGSMSVCVGHTTHLHDVTGLGTWTSSNPTVATISTSGVVTGISAGTTTIDYTLSSGCFVTCLITVNDVPAPITGTAGVCVGSVTTLADGTGSGTWSSSNIAIATVDASGIVTGAMNGICTITYTLATGCYATKLLTVYLTPTPFSGPTSVCVGNHITVHDGITGGVWSSSNIGVATINTLGVVTGISPGVSTIDYTLASTGCFATEEITVNENPAPITGTTAICNGMTTTLFDATVGGVWSSSNTTVATVSLTGIVTEVGIGTCTIYYTLPTGCFASVIVSANAPVVSCPGIIICCGQMTSTTISTTVDGILNPAPYPASVYSFSWTTTTADYSLSNYFIANPVCSLAYCDWESPISYLYLTVTNNATGCVTTISVEVEMIEPLHALHCTPCTMTTPACGGAYQPLNTTANVGPGNYYLSTDAIITGNISFTDANIIIENGRTINIDPEGSLTVNGSHLHSCSGNMWQGIYLQSNSMTTQTGTLVLQADGAGVSTLIEDANIAVDVEKPLKPNSWQNNFVTCNNVIFNSNYIGIQIANYVATSSTLLATPKIYEFDIENTVFTGRDFSSYHNTTCAYPFIWPNTTGTNGLKTSWIPTDNYMAGFNIGNPYAGPSGTGYPGVPCHIPITGATATIGINLINVGYYDGATYTGMQIGEADTHNPCQSGSKNIKLNLFDTLNFGIYASDANVTAMNNSFAHMVSNKVKNVPSVSGDGIYAQKVKAKKCQLSVIPGVHVPFCFMGTLYSPNSFYNCPFGVYALNYDSVAGIMSYMVNTQNNVTNTNSGFYGYDLQAGPYWDVYNITKNNIYNIANGIAMRMVPVSYGGLITPAHISPGPGQTYINNNHIQAVYNNNYLTIGNHYVDKAIWVENICNYMYPVGVPVTVTNQVNVNNNELGNVYNGVYVNGVADQMATTNADTISLVQYPTTGTQQFGIWHLNCMNDQVRQNKIFGEIYDHLYDNDLIYGVKISSSSKHVVTCNYVTNVGRGFEFENTHMSSIWQHNTMTNNRKGFVLNAGQIWEQGNHMAPSANEWHASGGFSWSLPDHPQTVTELGADPNNSLLWVHTGTFTDPTKNNNDVYSCLLTYGCSGGVTTGSGNGLNPTYFSEYFNCLDVPIISHNPIPLQKMTQKVDSFNEHKNQHHWMSQYSVWEAMQKNDTLGGSSEILTTFKGYCQNSRYGFLKQVEQKIALGNVDTAQYLLDNVTLDALSNATTDSTTGVQMADDTTADGIVGSYRQYYQLHINYLNNNLTTADSSAIKTIASACPFTNGAVVYKARALYNVVFDTLSVFGYTCDTTTILTGGGARKGQNKNNGGNNDGTRQNYTLIPNPNDGNFLLQQLLSDNNPVIVEVLNATGIVVYKQQVVFNGNVSKFNIDNLSSGLYLVHLQDCKGSMFIQKFVINK